VREGEEEGGGRQRGGEGGQRGRESTFLEKEGEKEKDGG
jgi:hypothetical protein